MPSRLFFLFLAMAPLLAACGLETGEPSRTPAPPAPKPPLSRLAVTLDIPADQLARLFDNMTEYRIADLKDQPVNCGIGRCRLDLLATRRGQVTVKAEDGALTLHMPFAVTAEMNAPGSFSFLRAKGEGEGVADARASLSLTPELALQAKTDGRVTLDNGHLRLGPIVTNIAQIWNDNQEKLAKPIWRSLDKQISALPLRDGWRICGRHPLRRSEWERRRCPGWCYGPRVWTWPNRASPMAESNWRCRSRRAGRWWCKISRQKIPLRPCRARASLSSRQMILRWPCP